MTRNEIKAEAREITQLVKRIRYGDESTPPYEGNLSLVQEEELMDMRAWLAKRDHENQLMQLCIATLIAGGSACEFCEEKGQGCQKVNDKGCQDWWLRFLTKEEEEACEQRATATGEEAGPSMGSTDPGTEKRTPV